MHTLGSDIEKIAETNPKDHERSEPYVPLCGETRLHAWHPWRSFAVPTAINQTITASWTGARHPGRRPLAYCCETHSAHVNPISAYIVDAYGIRHSFTCLTNCPLSIQAARIQYSSLQWWALPGQPTDAARLTPSLAKVAYNA